jgi:ABC-2 type transport system ATP-binding protein
VQVAGSPESLRQWVELNRGVALVEMRKRGARLNFEADTPDLLAAVLKKMIGDGLAITEFHREGRKLEDAFVDMLRKTDPLRPPPLPPSATPS